MGSIRTVGGRELTWQDHPARPRWYLDGTEISSIEGFSLYFDATEERNSDPKMLPGTALHTPPCE